MKVSFYVLHLGVGGVEKYVSTLANMLVGEHEVEIISTYQLNDKPAFHLNTSIHVEYLLKDLKPNRDEIKSSLKSKNPFRILREIWNAIEILCMKYYRNIASIKRCNSDVIISTRIFHNKLIGRYAKKNIIKITGEHNYHNSNKKYINSVITSCKKFDYFIPISKELYNFYYDAMKQINVKSEYIRFCIDESPMERAPSFKHDEIISVGRLSPEKGIPDLVEIFENVKSKNEKAVLHIVGDGEEYSKIAQAIEHKNLMDSIKMHGFQNKKFIYNLLPNTSLYVMTSHTESFGIVLLEAMSCGIPCVAYSSARGAHEIIEDGVNGYLVRNRDSNDMQNKICELLNDKDELRRLSGNALKTAEKFSYSNTKMAWLELMQRIKNEMEKIND